MDNSKQIQHTFTISNDGDLPLKIGKIRACCGASAGIGHKTIQPGTNTALWVKLSLRGRKGKQRKSFYVASNDPKQPYLQVRLVGNAVASVDVRPRSVKFGRVAPDAVVSQRVSIVCQAQHAFSITNIVSTVPRFAATTNSKNTGTHELTVHTVPPLMPGVTKGKIHILTDSLKHKKLTVHVTATVTSDILVVPKEILVVEAGESPEPATRYLAIRSRENKPFNILRVVPPEPDIRVQIDPLGTGYRLTLSNILPFPDLDGKEIAITTDHDTVKHLVIPIKVVAGESSRNDGKDGRAD